MPCALLIDNIKAISAIKLTNNSARAQSLVPLQSATFSKKSP